MKERNRIIGSFVLLMIFGVLMLYIYGGMLSEIDAKSAQNAQLKQEVAKLSSELRETTAMLAKTSCIMQIMVETINQPVGMLKAFEQHCSSYAEDKDLYRSCIVTTIERTCGGE